MRTPYESYSANEPTAAGRTTPTFKQQSAIPYHARENSLPFSYGQIGTTSTPLRSTANAKIGNGRIGGVGGGYTSYDDNYSFGGISGASENDGGGGGGMLKSQPRLTSPILVRKTLNRSPTRSNSNTNTISNIYQYKYNGGDNSLNGGCGGDNNHHHIYSNGLNSYNSRDSGKSGYNTTNGMNGHSSPNNQHFGYNNNNNNNNYQTTNGKLSSSPSLRSRTPTRNDFDELLRDRREKVYNEYRATTHDLRTQTTASSTSSSSNRQPPEPPQRQWHLTSSLPNGRLANGSTTKHITNTSATPTKPPLKYNYDFEFNLNIQDEVDGSVQLPPRRSNTMDRSIFQQQQQQQQYRTRDIPLPPETMSKTATNSYVERNYHTISSANAANERPGIGGGGGSADADLAKYVYQPLQQPQQRTHIATYGNENVSGYGYNGYSHSQSRNQGNGNIITATEKYEYNDRGSLGGSANNNNDLSPIYATTTKQTARRNIANNVNFNNNNNMANNNNNNMATITRTTTTRTTTDYPQKPPLHGSSMSNVSMISRPETPAFPTTPRTPYGMNNGAHTPNTLSRSEYAINGGVSQQHQQQQQQETIYQTTYRPRLNSSLSMMNSEPQEVAAHLVKFAKDSSRFWYKPQLSRDEAIALLLNAEPGTFVVRDSTTYKNAYGLVVRVAQPPAGVASGGKPDELVRHFLIEPTTRGVRLKGCPNEPVFQSLSALVYQHSINQLALPCLLRIPEHDLVRAAEPSADQMQLLTQGAACNVLWLYSSETESLTGEEAIRKTIRQLYSQKPLPTPLVVHFKVTPQGITLTDNTRKKFFRKHYAADIISFCAIDPDNRQWSMLDGNGNGTEPNDSAVVGTQKKTIFAFVARRSASSKDNQCHVFCDLAITQPASAIVSFVNKTLPTEKQRNYVL